MDEPTQAGGSATPGPPGPEDPGWKDTLDEAISAAWDRRHGNGPVFKADIYVKGNNPITGYRVHLTSTT